MVTSLLIGALLSALAPVPLHLQSVEAAPEPPSLLVRGVTVLDVETGRLEPFRSLRLSGGLVSSVGAASELQPEEGELVLEGRGAILIPGLAEMHGHLPDKSQGPEFARDVMFLYLSQGITTVLGMLGDEQQLELREAVKSGDVLGPRLVVGSPPMHGGSTQTVEAARSQVAAYAAAG